MFRWEIWIDYEYYKPFPSFQISFGNCDFKKKSTENTPPKDAYYIFSGSGLNVPKGLAGDRKKILGGGPLGRPGSKNWQIYIYFFYPCGRRLVGRPRWLLFDICGRYGHLAGKEILLESLSRQCFSHPARTRTWQATGPPPMPWHEGYVAY